MREEVSRLKHQVHKISFHGAADDLQAIQADLDVVREHQVLLIKEKQKVQQSYKALLADKQQFKRDLENFKQMNKLAEGWQTKKDALKKVKALLDSKITNINACINSLAKAETELYSMERALDKKIREEEVDELRSELSVGPDRPDLTEVDGELNSGPLGDLYNNISRVQTVDRGETIRMIDRDIKSRLSSNFSRKLMQRNRSSRGSEQPISRAAMPS